MKISHNRIDKLRAFAARLLPALLSLFIFITPAAAENRPFNNPSNWGGTGLMEIPNARVIDDGVLRSGYAQADPYRWYTGAMGIFPGVEFSGRYTEMTNLDTTMSGFGNLKDKAFDLKYQILPETRQFPALALGVQDFHGTQLFEAQYLVLSRQVFPLDFTLGLGRKRLRGSVQSLMWDELGLFGGIEWAVTDRLHLMAEYNPIRYEDDVKKAVPGGADSPINLGLRVKLFPGVDVGLSYQRGNTLGFMCHLNYKIGKPIAPKRPDPPVWPGVNADDFIREDSMDRIEAIRRGIAAIGFQDVSVATDDRCLVARFENTKYLSNAQAAGRALRIMLARSPMETETLSVIFLRRRMPFLKVSVKPEPLREYVYGRISQETFRAFVTVETTSSDNEKDSHSPFRTGHFKPVDFHFGVKPDFQLYFNDPSGVFKPRIGMKPYVVSRLWKGAAATIRYDLPVYSDVDSSNEPLPDAVRSDSWKYQGDDPAFDRIVYDQAFRLSAKTFGRLSGGYLESMYAGIGGEVLFFAGDGNLAIGIEGDWVRKRAPGTQLDLLDQDGYTLLGNLYYRMPVFDVTLHAQYGRFLAGDRGWRFEASREYDTGAIVGFWYSNTDTGDLESFNSGYHDKGVFLKVPVRMFTHAESRTRYTYAMSPWTRDVAVTVDHWQDLWGLGADLMPSQFWDKWKSFRD
jgi:hypothetical protein